MLEQFLNHIERNRLADMQQNILLAVSGGLDSMVMLHLFRECGFRVGVAHCNFQLRGAESDEDEKLVGRICNELSVPLAIKKFELADYVKETGLSTQMAARELRYQWFEELLEREAYDLLATAHHLDDSLETILMNLVKGSGYEGISGIKVKAGKVIRPMLFTSRQHIHDYAHANRIVWREDSSNSSDKYQRNFIRNNVVPLLRELNPGLEKTFVETHERLSYSWKLYRNALEAMFRDLVEYKNDQTLVDKEKLLQMESRAVVLWEMIKGFGFNYDQCSDIVNPIHSAGTTFHSSTHQVTIDRTKFIVRKRTTPPKFNLSIRKNEKLVTSHIGSIALSIVEKPPTISRSGYVAELDLEKIQFPLTWRTWEHGDSFVPLGMKRSKKLSDFLVDEKVSLPDKERISVVAGKDGVIMWIVGYRIDDRFKITGSTREILRLEYSTRR